MTGKAILICGFAMCALGACSSDGNTALATITAGLGRIAAAPVQPAAVAEFSQPTIQVSLPQRGAVAFVQRGSVNSGVELWVAADGVTISLDRGVVVATRGLGGDLMTADVSDVHQGLFGGRAQGERIHVFLDGENQEVRRALVCDYTNQGAQTLETAFGRQSARLVEESCATVDATYSNAYWLDGRGIARSRQWIGPAIGFMELDYVQR